MSDPVFAFKLEDGRIRSIKSNSVISITEAENGAKILVFDPTFGHHVYSDSCESIGDLTHRWRQCFNLEGYLEAKEIRISTSDPIDEEVTSE